MLECKIYYTLTGRNIETAGHTENTRGLCKIFLLTIQKRYFFCGSFVLFMS